MARSSNSAVFAGVVVALVIAALIGIQRAGFGRVNTTANPTAGELQELAGTVTELLPLLVLVAAAVFLLRTVQ
jgi:hypothetical protein